MYIMLVEYGDGVLHPGGCIVVDLVSSCCCGCGWFNEVSEAGNLA